MKIDIHFQLGKERKHRRIQVEKIFEHIIGNDVLIRHLADGDGTG